MDIIIARIEQIHEELEQIITEIWMRNNLIFDFLMNKVPSKERVQHLVNSSKGAVQRTEEWYSKREGCITASDISAVLGTNKYRKLPQVVIDKCCPQQKFKGNFYTEWGQRYEPLATIIYEHLYNCKIYEAPLLIHSLFPFVGASTDGFIVDEKNNEGALIEIKCPYARIPKENSIPEHYWEQPQTQMEVAKVNKAFFFDCRFEEYLNEEDYLNEHKITKQPILKGIMLEYLDQSTGKICYIYPKEIEPHRQDNKEDLLQEMNKLKNVIFSRFIYWRLVLAVRLEIKRDHEWFRKAIPQIKQCWELIKEHRVKQLSENELRESLKARQR